MSNSRGNIDQYWKKKLQELQVQIALHETNPWYDLLGTSQLGNNN